MSVTGLVDLVRGRPRHPMGADGRMALSDHFRELRARLIKSAIAVVVAFGFALYFYDQLLDLITVPYYEAVEGLDGRVDTRLVVNNITGGLMLQLKLCGVAAIVGASPVWLYQIWGFLLPGLHRNELMWSRIFAAVAGPLFFAGVALGYFVLPKGMEVLINFTPAGSENLNEFSTYFSFVTRMLLVFGIALEIPLFVVMLNLVGVLSGRAIGRHRPWIVLGTFVFAAVATPSTDPFAMSALAITMSLLFLISEMIARTVDRIRGRNRSGTDQWADDETSTL
ncbi:twin-arginine translocase subunit TatC [Nocardioides donggukensis]|uniref:Sec-independent protein translocase protein TatC n=1 Tax=Nocardioides donggukensis TaxID=2774019 RepID=A0A927K2U4_9ACTN|nr:twin-arginine translocase subunit TatC [Nocardioides donggukensis]MBD8869532.1 twin-arginine translocase subunit TatC [Nocardioides donggukensis]